MINHLFLTFQRRFRCQENATNAMKDELIGGDDSIVNFNSHASLFLSLWIRFLMVLPTFAALNMAPRTLRLVCLACFYGWLTLAASFTKRYPSNIDETLFRFHRSRIQQWQNKCRRQQRIRRSRRESVALSSASSNRRTRTSGTRLFWGKPSRQSISQRFWDASVPEFNNDNAGDFTNPLLTVTSTTSLTESREQETVRLKHDVAVPCSRRGGTNGDNESQGWWPTIPFLGLVGMRLKGPFVHRPLVVEGCNLLCRYMSGVIMSRRVLCYRLEVGEGLGCYERVRDAALKWEFDSGDKGIQAVPSDPPRTGSSQQSSWKSVHPLESTTLSAYRSEARGHRMVSWSRVGPLYVLSPVAVIYECLNQRGTGKDGASTVFTSCA